jgi:tartrate dehydratase alpha subunit/fumarate hydratase class I-like protein
MSDRDAWVGDHSVWYSWQAPSGFSIVVVDVCTAAIDSIVAVYSGNSLTNLTRVIDNNNDNCPSGWGSRVSFLSKPNQEYRIAVADAGGGRENTFTLSLNATVL